MVGRCCLSVLVSLGLSFVFLGFDYVTGYLTDFAPNHVILYLIIVCAIGLMNNTIGALFSAYILGITKKFRRDSWTIWVLCESTIINAITFIVCKVLLHIVQNDLNLTSMMLYIAYMIFGLFSIALFAICGLTYPLLISPKHQGKDALKVIPESTRIIFQQPFRTLLLSALVLAIFGVLNYGVTAILPHSGEWEHIGQALALSVYSTSWILLSRLILRNHSWTETYVRWS